MPSFKDNDAEEIENRQPTSKEVCTDWTWRWEFADNWRGIQLNAGTEKEPEWVMLR